MEHKWRPRRTPYVARRVLQTHSKGHSTRPSPRLLPAIVSLAPGHVIPTSQHINTSPGITRKINELLYVSPGNHPSLQISRTGATPLLTNSKHGVTNDVGADSARRQTRTFYSGYRPRHCEDRAEKSFAPTAKNGSLLEGTGAR